MHIAKPQSNESNEFYEKYIGLVHDNDLIPALEKNSREVSGLFESIPSEIEVFRYDTHKWSIKEVFLHIIDFERYLCFKAFVSLRNDKNTIVYHPDRDHYLRNAYAETRTLNDLLPEFHTVRMATISMFRHANDSQISHTANHANASHAVSASALGFAIAGHATHHMQVINEKYLRMSGLRKK